MINPTQRPLPENRTHPQEKDIRAPGRIRDRNLHKWTVKNHALDGVATVIGKYKCLLIAIILRKIPRLYLSLRDTPFLCFYDYLWIKFCVFTEVDWLVLFLECDIVWLCRNWCGFPRKVPHQSYRLQRKLELPFWKVKVKVTLVQALRLCTGRTAHRGSRGIALPFHDHGTRRGWGVSVTPRPLFTPGERPGTHCTGGWVGLRAGLDTCGKLAPTGIRSPDRPARNQSLYRLRYPAHTRPNVCIFLRF